LDTAINNALKRIENGQEDPETKQEAKKETKQNSKDDFKENKKSRKRKFEKQNDQFVEESKNENETIQDLPIKKRKIDKTPRESIKKKKIQKKAQTILRTI